MGCHPLSVVTALTVQDTHGRGVAASRRRGRVRMQAERLLADVRVGAFQGRRLGSPPTSRRSPRSSRTTLREIPVVLDPVLASGRGDELATEEMIAPRCASFSCRRRRS